MTDFHPEFHCFSSSFAVCLKSSRAFVRQNHVNHSATAAQLDPSREPMDLQQVVQLPKVLDQNNLIRYLPLIARVRAHIWQSVPPWIDADDLIQVGAQTLAEMGHIPPGVRNEEAWLWTIIERAMWSYVRSECTEAHDVLVEERPAEVETIEDQLIRRDERQHVRRAVRTLPPAERHVITMRLAGRKQGEIAAQAGVSRQRVGFLEGRAVTRMRRALVPLAAAA